MFTIPITVDIPGWPILHEIHIGLAVIFAIACIVFFLIAVFLAVEGWQESAELDTSLEMRLTLEQAEHEKTKHSRRVRALFIAGLALLPGFYLGILEVAFLLILGLLNRDKLDDFFVALGVLQPAER